MTSYKKVLNLPVALHAHIDDLPVAYQRYRLRPELIDAALFSLPGVISVAGRKPKSHQVTSPQNDQIMDLAKRHDTTQWKIVAALLFLAAWDSLCPSHCRRRQDLPNFKTAA